MKRGGTTVVRAGAIADAFGVTARPGVIVVRRGRIVAAGDPDHTRHAARHTDRVIELPDRLLTPTLVNAHAHLDLTGLGPRSFEGDFVGWLKMVIRERPTAPEAVQRGVQRGAEQSIQAGVGWLGDVAGSPLAIQARRAARLPGVSYLECTGLGERQQQQIEQIRGQLESLEFETPVPALERGVVLGLSPHAPYSAGERLYDWAADMSRQHAMRLVSHVAESPEELELLKEAKGPLRDLLLSLGVPEPDLPHPHAHPVDYLAEPLRHARWLLAHCNYLEPPHIERLRVARASVVYCPRASAYFGHHNHPYRQLLDAGVNVCLGTDSIVCQPADDPQPLSIMGQMRFLYQHDRADPTLLLDMATARGMVAMELDDRLASFGRHAPARFCLMAFDPANATDPLTQALERRDATESLELTEAAERDAVETDGALPG